MNTAAVTFAFDFDKKEKAPLFHQYPGELIPQPAFISNFAREPSPNRAVRKAHAAKRCCDAD